MKTTNNVQKTENRKFAAGILALALILANVNSNGRSKERQKSFTNESQIALVTSNYKSGKNLQTKNEKLATESNEGTEFLSFQPETENSLQIETWMLVNKYFTVEKTETGTDVEKPLKIEDWMTNFHVWNK